TPTSSDANSRRIARSSRRSRRVTSTNAIGNAAPHPDLPDPLHASRGEGEDLTLTRSLAAESGTGEEAGEDCLPADAGETHRHLHVGARALPAAHLADAERGVAQLGADLQAAAPLIGVVLDADLAGRAAARGPAPRRRQRQARARRLLGLVARP